MYDNSVWFLFLSSVRPAAKFTAIFALEFLWMPWKIKELDIIKSPEIQRICQPSHDRAIFLWPWNENARTKQKQQTNGNRAIWLVYRTDTNARGFWLVKRINAPVKKFHAREPSRNQSILRFDVILQHDWPIEQCLSSYKSFLWRENGESMFWSFHLFVGQRSAMMVATFFETVVCVAFLF